MIKAVLFDLDGTLLNRDASVQCFIENQYERFIKHLKHIPKEVYVERFITLDNRGYVWKDKVYTQLTKELNISSVSVGELLDDYVSEFRQHCIPFEGLRELLDELKSLNLKLGIITNGFGQFQLDNIKALGIEKDFDVISISEWEGIKKPSLEIFERALKKLQVEPATSVFIGDHPMNDIEPPKKVGMISIWKKDVAWQDVKADYTIEHLKEIPAIIRDI
ncbi:MAG: HAD family hydrolase [Lysinibacillus sp.]